jgi:adenylate cyclase
MRYICITIALFIYAQFFCFAQNDSEMAKLEELAHRGDYRTATLEAIKLAKKLSDQRRERDANEYYQKAAKYSDNINDLAVRASAYEELGDSYYRSNEVAKAIANLKIAAGFHERLGAAKAQTEVINKIGFTERMRNKNYDAAVKNFKRSLQIAENNNLFASQLASYDLLAKTFEESGDAASAQAYRNLHDQLKNKASNTRIDTYDAQLREAKEQLEEAKAMNENQKKALEYRIANIEKEKSKISKVLSATGDSLENATFEAQAASARALAEEEKSKRAQTQLYFSYGGIALLLVFSGIFFSLFRSRNIANKRLAEQNIQIKKQAEELEQRGKELHKEKEKSEKLLLNILPAKVAEELKEKNYAAPRSYEMVTVLFTDFKGFTSMAEKMRPEEIISELNTIFSEFDRICKEYNLEKIKTIGDAYMCAGGIPEPNTTNAIDAIKAALEMQQYMKVLADKKQARDEQYFELRLGINTGPIVAGVVGESKFAYDIWGDTVNLASRMESAGEVGMVNISNHTYELVKDHFDCTYRGRVSVKNKGEVEMYFVNYKKWW